MWANAKKNKKWGNYEINSSEQVIDISMKVPLYDQITNKPYAINKLRAPLIKLLNSLIPDYKVQTTKNTGQQISLRFE